MGKFRKDPTQERLLIDWSKIETVEDIKAVILADIALDSGGRGISVMPGKSVADIEGALSGLLVDVEGE